MDKAGYLLDMKATIRFSIFFKIGMLLAVLGLLVLGLEDTLFDGSKLLTALYLVPIGCFFSSFIAFIFAATNTSNY
jgi:hypothetical protein